MVDAELARDNEGGVQLTNASFATTARMMGDIDDFDIRDVHNDLGQLLDRFTNRGSGYTLLCITKCRVLVAKYNPLVGSSYIPTPPGLVNRKAVVNVRNTDQKCFQWAVLSALFPVNDCNTHRVNKYSPFVDNVNFSSLKFPVTLPQIRQFERLNVNIRINVYVYHDGDIVPVYLSKHGIRPKHIDLLLLKEGDNAHYTWIKSMSRLGQFHEQRPYKYRLTSVHIAPTRIPHKRLSTIISPIVRKECDRKLSSPKKLLSHSKIPKRQNAILL